jgi:hypothetical protein
MPEVLPAVNPSKAVLEALAEAGFRRKIIDACRRGSDLLLDARSRVRRAQ